MRPLLLKVSGLNSFIEEETIEFSRLLEKGLFGIFGPTGSGKSSILDAITMALYGKISRDTNEFINTETEQLSVHFEFEMSGAHKNTYLIQRNIKQKEDGGYQTTLCRLICQKNGNEIIYDKVSDVNEAVEKIIGLKHDDFVRSVVLPQGKFSEFLKLKNKPRRDMLERILGLEEFGKKLLSKIKEARNNRENKVENLSGALSKYQGITEEGLTSEKQLLQEKIELHNKVKNELTQLTQKFEFYRDIWKAQQELAVYQEKKVKLDSNQEVMENKEIKLNKAKNAEKIKPYLQRFEQDKIEYDNLTNQENQLREQIVELDSENEKLTEEYRIASQRRDDKLPELIRLTGKVEEAIRLQEKNRELLNNYNQKEQLAKETQSTLERSKTRLNEIMRNIDKQEFNSTKLTNEIEQLKIAATDRKKIAVGADYERSYQENETELNLLKEEEDKVEKQLNIFKRELKNREEKLNHLKTVIETYQKRKEGLQENPPKDEEVIYQEKLLLDNQKKIKAEFLVNQEKYQDSIETLEKLIKEKQQLEQQLNHLKSNLNPLKAKLENMEKEIKQIERHNLAGILARELTTGIACPVCGSFHHPKPAKQTEDDLEQLKIKKTEIEQQFKEMTEDSHKIDIDRQIIEKEIDRYQQEKEKYLKMIANINYDQLILEIEQKEVDIKESSNKLSQWKKEKEELTVKVTNLEKEKVKLNEEIIRLRERQKSKVDSQQKTKEKMVEFQRKLEEIKNNLEPLEEETGITDFTAEAKQIAKKDHEREIMEKKLRKLQQDQVNLKQELEQYRDKVNNEQRDFDLLKQELKTIKRSIESNEREIKAKIGENEPELFLQEIEKQKTELIKTEKDKKNQLEINKNNLNKIREEVTGIVSRLENLDKSLEETLNFLEKKITDFNFTSVKEAKTYLISTEKIKKLQEEIDLYHDLQKEIKTNINRLKNEINGQKITEKDWQGIVERKSDLEKNNNEMIGEIAARKEKVNTFKTDLEEKKQLAKDKQKLEHELAIIKDIYDLVGANKFVEFVAIQRLEYIAREASKKLMEITNNRYLLELDSQGEFVICDNYNGGVRRDCNTLSGGETFLTSLSLALALSSQIQLKGGSNLEFFFLDEGFGTLDANLLDIVMTSLEQLQTENLTVGIISHVEELKNRVPIKLIVQPAEAGITGSKVELEYS